MDVPPTDQKSTCTQAELEFTLHLNRLKIKLEDGTAKCMVERKARGISGKWIYLCYPCGAICDGEVMLQSHLSGKKHKMNLTKQTVWPNSIFSEHPYMKNTQTGAKGTSQKVEKVTIPKNVNETDAVVKHEYSKYRNVTCYIQKTLDSVMTPLVGVEYLIEHPADNKSYKPNYTCTLCDKQGQPGTIVNHLTATFHRDLYLSRHFSAAYTKLLPFKRMPKELNAGFTIVKNRFLKSIVDKYGVMRPVCIDKEEYERNKLSINKWLYAGPHFTEQEGATFEDVIDTDFIKSSLNDSNQTFQSDTTDKVNTSIRSLEKKESSPCFTATTPKTQVHKVSWDMNRHECSEASVESRSYNKNRDEERRRPSQEYKARREAPHGARHEPSPERPRDRSPLRHQLTDTTEKKPHWGEYHKDIYKMRIAEDKRQVVEADAKKAFEYHQKNPEKHPLYPVEWKKFWSKRYKEIVAEGKDPSKHDFKSDWIKFWMVRIKEIYEEEIRVEVNEIYRLMCLSPPNMTRQSAEKQPKSRSKSPERRLKNKNLSPAPRNLAPAIHKRSPERHRNFVDSPKLRSRSPVLRKRSPELRKRVSDSRRKLPDKKRKSPSTQKPLTQRRTSNHREPNKLSTPVKTRVLKTPSRSPVRSQDNCVLISDSDKEQSPVESVVGTLRMLVALEDYLGSLGPSILNLLTEALRMEKVQANSSEELLLRESAFVMVEMATERLKGAKEAGLLPKTAFAAVNHAIARVSATLQMAYVKFKQSQVFQKTQPSTISKPAPVAGAADGGEIDRAQIAQQMAEALIAQGKTDVSAEQLSQLVDTVVDMAETKKREADKRNTIEQHRVEKLEPQLNAKIFGTMSALQKIQSAYDAADDKVIEKENIKNYGVDKNTKDYKIGEENIKDLIDSLTDSDLKILLSNFDKLSAEEQHSLIAYLRKLESRDPMRVERFREFFNHAATLEPLPAKNDIKNHNAEPVNHKIKKDVMKFVSGKVEELPRSDEIITVKRPMEESKPEPMGESTAIERPRSNLTNNLSSTTNVLALVHASLNFTTTSAPSSVAVPQKDAVSCNQRKFYEDMPNFMTFNKPDQPNRSHCYGNNNYKQSPWNERLSNLDQRVGSSVREPKSNNYDPETPGEFSSGNHINFKGRNNDNYGPQNMNEKLDYFKNNPTYNNLGSRRHYEGSARGHAQDYF